MMERTMTAIASIKKTWLATTAAATLGTVVLGVSALAAVPNAPPSILVFNQKVAGTTISVDYANIPVDGYVVVYAADEDGKRTGKPLGSVAVKAGSHIDLKVNLSQVPKPGAALWASLYKDKDGEEGFDPKGDKPVWTKLPMQNAFTIQ
jgi:hypothetical protein